MAPSIYMQAKRAAGRFRTEASQRQAVAKVLKKHGYTKMPTVRQGYFGHGGTELRFYWYQDAPGGDLVLVAARGYKPEVYRFSDLKRVKRPGFSVAATDPRSAVVRALRTEYAASRGGGKPKKTPKGRSASRAFGFPPPRRKKAAPPKKAPSKKKKPARKAKAPKAPPAPRRALKKRPPSRSQLGLFGGGQRRGDDLDRLVDEAIRSAELADIQGLGTKRKNPRGRKTGTGRIRTTPDGYAYIDVGGRPGPMIYVGFDKSGKVRKPTKAQRKKLRAQAQRKNPRGRKAKPGTIRVTSDGYAFVEPPPGQRAGKMIFVGFTKAGKPKRPTKTQRAKLRAAYRGNLASTPRRRNTHLAVGSHVKGSYGKGTVKMQLPGDRYVVQYGRKGRRVEEGRQLKRA